MSVALCGCEDFSVVYIDDILVYSRSVEEYLGHLEAVFCRLVQHGYHVRINKCELMQAEVEFLGHRLSAQGLTMSTPKVDALCAWQPPLRSTLVKCDSSSGLLFGTKHLSRILLL